MREVNGVAQEVITPFRGSAVASRISTPFAATVRLRRRPGLAPPRTRPGRSASVGGPLIRGPLRLSDEDDDLLIVITLSATGGGMGVLFRELAALYETRCALREPALPVLPVQMADFAAWQRAHLPGGTLDSQVSYWRTQLDGAPAVLAPPTDRRVVDAATERGACERVVWPPLYNRRTNPCEPFVLALSSA